MQAVADEYKQAGVLDQLIIESKDADVQGQIQQIRDLMNKGVDAIIINPNSLTALNPVVKEAKDAGITVLAIDQEIDSPDVAANIGIDQKAWAQPTAEWLAKQMNGKGNIVIINGVAGHPANEARVVGYKEVFAKYPDIKILNEVNANWDEATGQQKMADLLASQPNIDGVWSQDGMAEGALRALIAANPKKWPVMVGEGRAGYLQLWQDAKKLNPNFGAFANVNQPGVGADGLRVAIGLLQGKKFKDGVLVGKHNNIYHVPVPFTVGPDNYDAEYAKVKDKPANYTLDGMLTQAQVDALFQ